MENFSTKFKKKLFNLLIINIVVLLVYFNIKN